MNHPAEKYCKFAYSARFGFCVSHSNYNLAAAACDSMLMLSENDNYWRQRRDTTNRATGENWTQSVWHPWPDVEITTTLVSLGDWHIRVHKIVSVRHLKTAEGGYPLPRYHNFDEAVEVKNTAHTKHEALVSFDWGASRIIALEPNTPHQCPRQGSLVISVPNLNIIEPSAVIPILTGTLEPGTIVLACAVRAGDTEPVTNAKVPSLLSIPEAFRYTGIEKIEKIEKTTETE
jgi:hypothetical protein